MLLFKRLLDLDLFSIFELDLDLIVFLLYLLNSLIVLLDNLNFTSPFKKKKS